MDTADPGSPRFIDQRLYEVSNEIIGFDSTWDGKLLFWFERAADGQVLPVVNGTAGPSFDAFWDPNEELGGPLRQMIVESVYNFSDDGCHFAYVGRRGDRFFAAIDGVQGGEYEQIWGGASFRGPTSFYHPTVDGKTRLVQNGELQPEQEVVPWRDTASSADGRHSAFVVQVPGGEAVVFDGKAGQPFAWIVTLSLKIAPNGRLSYEAALPRKRFRHRRFAFVVDGDVVAESRSLYARLSPDGRRTYYLDHGSHRWFVDGMPLPEGTKQAEFAPDGRLYTDLDGHAFVDGTPLGVPAWHLDLVFGAEGQHSAWSARVGGKYVLVRDGEIASEEMDFIGNLLFSPDGRRLSFRAWEGAFPAHREWVIVDGSEGARFDRVAFWHFSPDSQHLAYWAEEGGKVFLVLDHGPGPALDELRQPASGPFPGVFDFSPDSKHVAGVARLGAQLRPLVDATLGPTFERLAQPVFHADGTVSFFGLREKVIYRLSVTL